jgi:hypothetical protein
MDPKLPPGMKWGTYCHEPSIDHGDSMVGMLTQRDYSRKLWDISVKFNHENWKTYPELHTLDEAKHILAVMMWTL